MKELLANLRPLEGSWGWISQVFIVVLGVVVLNLVLRVVLRRLHERLSRTRSAWDDALVDAMRPPAVALLWIVGLAFAADIINRKAEAPIFEMVDPMRDVGVIATITWFLVRLIRRVEENLLRQHEVEGAPVDRTTMDAVAKLLRVSVLITAGLVALQTLGFSISGVLAFGGIGGIAVGFAARDLLANFFGGLMVYLDRPFVVGEWVRSPDREIEGTVEEIGWRLTRIRTFDKRLLYVPNATFTQVTVENPSRMSHRRIKETIGVRYEDTAKVAAIVADVRRMIHDHPEIDDAQTTMVHFDSFGASSLDFFIYCFTKTTAWTEYHRVKEDVLLKIHDIIAAHGAEVAFPTRTLHVPEGLRVSGEAAGEDRPGARVSTASGRQVP